MFTMIFWSMLGEHNGEGGLGGGWKLMAQWFVSWTFDQQVHNGAHARVTVSCSQARHLTLSLPLSLKSVNGTGLLVSSTWQLLWVTYNGLSSLPWRVATLLVTSCLRNWRRALVLTIHLASLNPQEWNWLFCPVASGNITGMFSFLAIMARRGIWFPVWNRPFTI